MLRARKAGPLGWALGAYVTRKFRGAFRGLWARGPLPGGAPRPRLVYLNHANWWDGFVCHQLARAAGWDAYCLMEEAQLTRYPFLRRLGAFSIRPGEPHSSLESLRYARALLARPRTALFVFPEGVLRAGARPPLALRRGVEVLARAARDVECVPVAVRYRFHEHERPDVLLELGPAHGAAPLAHFAHALDACLTRLDAAEGLEGFRPLVRGGAGVAERWDRVRGAAG